jgi:hypothetical protein
MSPTYKLKALIANLVVPQSKDKVLADLCSEVARVLKANKSVRRAMLYSLVEHMAKVVSSPESVGASGDAGTPTENGTARTLGVALLNRDLYGMFSTGWLNDENAAAVADAMSKAFRMLRDRWPNIKEQDAYEARECFRQAVDEKQKYFN